MKMRWKKWLCWGMLLLILLSATGCEKQPVFDTDPAFNPETDCQYLWTNGFQYHVAESSEGYYYLSDNLYIHFVDKETLEDIVVCSKPNCKHEENSKLDAANPMYRGCDAYVDAADFHIFYYKEKIYVVEYSFEVEGLSIGNRHYNLLEISLDGAQRKQVYEFDVTTYSNGKGIPMVNGIMLHRGRIYYTVCYGTNEHVYFLSYDLQTKKTQLLYEGPDIQEISARGDALYFSAYKEENYTWDLWRYTISTGQKEVVGNEVRRAYENGSWCGRYDQEKEQQYVDFYSSEDDLVRSVEFPRYAAVEDANDRYIIAELQGENTYLEIATGKILSYEEYRKRWKELSYDSTAFEQYNTPEWTVFDAQTKEELFKIPIPDGIRSYTYLHGDQFFWVFNYEEIAFYQMDLSVPAGETPTWQTSQPVN